MDIIEKILDDNNCDDIFLTNELTGEELPFEQVATIPYNDIVYAILSPKKSTDDLSAGEGIVFKIIEEDGDSVLVMEEDEKIADKIYDIYEDMYRKEYGDIVFVEEDEKIIENKND